MRIVRQIGKCGLRTEACTCFSPGFWAPAQSCPFQTWPCSDQSLNFFGTICQHLDWFRSDHFYSKQPIASLWPSFLFLSFPLLTTWWSLSSTPPPPPPTDPQQVTFLSHVFSSHQPSQFLNKSTQVHPSLTKSRQPNSTEQETPPVKTLLPPQLIWKVAIKERIEACFEFWYKTSSLCASSFLMVIITITTNITMVLIIGITINLLLILATFITVLEWGLGENTWLLADNGVALWDRLSQFPSKYPHKRRQYTSDKVKIENDGLGENCWINHKKSFGELKKLIWDRAQVRRGDRSLDKQTINWAFLPSLLPSLPLAFLWIHLHQSVTKSQKPV